MSAQRARSSFAHRMFDDGGDLVAEVWPKPIAEALQIGAFPKAFGA